MNALTRIGSEVFDSRDVIEALEGLEGPGHQPTQRALEALNEWGEDNVSEWQDGEALIREDYFVDWAQQLAEDCGMLEVPHDTYNYANRKEARNLATEWPFRHIDWEAAAEELKQDYVDVEFMGKTYYVRSV